MSIMLLVQIRLFGKTRRKHFLCLPIRPDSQTRFFDRGNYGLGKISGGNRKIRSPWKANSRQVEATEKSQLLCCKTFAYNLCPPKAIPMLFPRSSCQIMPEIFLPDVIPSCHRLVCTTMIARMPIAISRYHSFQLPQLSWG